MKSFIISLCLAAALIGASCFYSIRLESISDELKSVSSSIADKINTDDFAAARSSADELSGMLDGYGTFLAALGNHEEVDKIESALAELKSYCEGKNKYDAAAKNNVLTFLFEHLPRNSRLKIENIL